MTRAYGAVWTPYQRGMVWSLMGGVYHVHNGEKERIHAGNNWVRILPEYAVGFSIFSPARRPTTVLRSVLEVVPVTV